MKLDNEMINGVEETKILDDFGSSYCTHLRSSLRPSIYDIQRFYLQSCFHMFAAGEPHESLGVGIVPSGTGLMRCHYSTAWNLIYELSVKFLPDITQHKFQ